MKVTQRPCPSGLRVCAWCLVAVVVEVALYVSYRGHDARFHYFTHFFVGSAAALTVMAAVAAYRRRPVALPLIWPLVGHVVAMFPDVLFRFGIAHYEWMDVFLGHVSVHFVPGREVTWLVVFLAALGLYLTVVDRLRAKQERAANQLLIRSWGEGPSVVFLHGLGASSRYWRPVSEVGRDFRGIAPDLLGFGRSDKPPAISYDLDCHLGAIDPHVPEGAVVVGHSMGAVLAAALARRRPDLAGVVLIGLPAYPEPATARTEIARLGLLARLTVEGNPAARLLCWTMCLFRPLAAAIGPILVRDLPKEIVADGVRHTWPSYHRSLQHLVLHAAAADDLHHIPAPTLLLHGTGDREAPYRYAEMAVHQARASGGRVELRTIDAGHHLAITHPTLVDAAITDVIRNRTRLQGP